MKTHSIKSAKEYLQSGQIRKGSQITAESGLNLNQPPLPINFARMINQSPCVTWILDIKAQTYTFISNNTYEHFGYSADNYIKNGPCFQDQIIHPEDQPRTKKLLSLVWRAFCNIPPESRANYRFSHDYRIIKPSGKIVRILEQNAVLQQDINGNITHLLGVCNDITCCKKNGLQCAELSSEIDKQHHFFTADKITEHKPSSILSKRELEIVKLIADGQSSKFIADKLFISFHTVNTHRQKMIEKTNTRNTGGLVQFAICNGLI